MESSTNVRYTYQDLASIPESHRRHEIVDGRLYVSALPRINHQVVAANVLFLLRSMSDQVGGAFAVGPVTVHIHDELVLEPDVVFVSPDRMDVVDFEGHIHGPPDLVAEILSPSTAGYDRDLKRKRYLEHGVAELWIVDIDARRVDVWKPGYAEPTAVEDLLRWQVDGERFELPLEEVFRGVDGPRG